jgi:hypothetical protein
MIAARADFLAYAPEEAHGGPIRVADKAQDGEK